MNAGYWASLGATGALLYVLVFSLFLARQIESAVRWAYTCVYRLRQP